MINEISTTYGVLKYQDDLEYEGDQVNGVAQGIGVLTHPKLNVIYRGGWLNDRFHGKGVMYDPAGKITYEGDFENGKQHGYGRSIFGQGIYEGEWVKGSQEGNGKVISKNGDVLIGIFRGGNIYPNTFKTWDFGFAKASGFNDRKQVHIVNIDLFTID